MADTQHQGVAHITDDQFEQMVLKSDKPVMVDFYADWCGPCQAYKPQFENCANSCTEDVIFVESSVDKNFIKVESLPSTIFIKNNQIIDKIVGIDIPQLNQKISQYA